jgi:hypothetical protein
MAPIVEKHVDIELDMCRSYAVIYEWIKGIDAAQACREGMIDEERMIELTVAVHEQIERLGFDVADRKPHHVIVRPRGENGILHDRHGAAVCALVDFELLTHTPEREAVLKRQKRGEYLRRQRDRFCIKTPTALPAGRELVTIKDVTYVTGSCERTGGRLWVVGKDPELFDFFLPERWEQTPRTRLSPYSEIYYTLSRDEIHLVWKLSKVGVRPDADPFREDERRILEHGYNSPFEEVALATQLSARGVPATYPRAIYMTGVKASVSASLYDGRRFRTHKELLTPEGDPILRDDRDYILIWGYWNGPDEKLADEDGNYYQSIDALRARREGLITQARYVKLLQHARERLLRAGVIDLNLRGSHLLLSILSSTGHLITDRHGMPEARICSFELLERVK